MADDRRVARRLIRRPAGRRFGAAVLALLTALDALSAAGPVAVRSATPPQPLASDSFSRSASGGWAAADSGGAYAHDGPAAFAVDGTRGVITLPRAGASRAALLNAVSARDSETLVRVQVDARPVGGGLWVFAVARRTAAGEYRPKAIVSPSGAVAVHAGAFVSGAESPVAPSRPAGFSVAAGQSFWLRSLVTGIGPTTISVKAWLDGTVEPVDWQFSATSTTAALQVPGSPGLRAYVSSVSNAPLAVGFDDLSVVSLDPPPVPVADFSWQQLAETRDIAFSDTSSGDPSEWSWDFGDGTTSAEQSPTHSYATEGAYSVSLTVTGAGGTDTTSVEILVEPPPPPPPPPPDPVTIVADDFERSGAADWRSAPTGGLYSYQGRLTDFTTDGSGVLTLPAAGATRSAFLYSALVLDAQLGFTVATDKPAAGAALFAYGALRRATDGSSYRIKIRFAPNGAVFAHASRFVAGSETSLGPSVPVDGLSHVAGVPIHVRGEVTGTDPTTVRLRAWAAGQPEPEVWHFSATDATPRLQAAGALGLIGHVAAGATNTPVAIRFDDLLVTTTAPVARVSGPEFLGAGDIATCPGLADEATARLLDLLSGEVFALGDLAYENGTAAEFATCYEPSWGRHRVRTHPVIGNHELGSPGATPYFDYFGLAAGDPAKGYYAFDIGTWRVYALNSNCAIALCASGSEQEQWLRADIAANPRACALALAHHPRFSSGSEHGSVIALQPLWQALHDGGVELLLSAHDHDYERLAPLDAAGQPDPAAGIRQFVVGTGGAALRATLAAPLPASEVRQATSHGLLRLVLGESEYEWEFIPIAGQGFTDRGSAGCH